MVAGKEDHSFAGLAVVLRGADGETKEDTYHNPQQKLFEVIVSRTSIDLPYGF